MANLFEMPRVEKINSATKYPSILTYHELGPRGEHIEALVEGMSFAEVGDCELTEKIDGTNTRIILYGDDYLIGSREDIIYAKGDRLINASSPTNAIINFVKDIAEQINARWTPDRIAVIYGEVYGGRVADKSKNYTRQADKLGFRVFDMAMCWMDDLKDKTVEQISSWRQHGGLKFAGSDELTDIIIGFRDIKLERVPVLKVIQGSDIPTSVGGVKGFLNAFRETTVGLTEDALGQSEGIVIRSLDRSFIRKMRFYSYNKS